MKRKLFLAAFAIVSIVGCSKKVEETNLCEKHDWKIHMLQQENMDIGRKLDSMQLKYDYPEFWKNNITTNIIF